MKMACKSRVIKTFPSDDENFSTKEEPISFGLKLVNIFCSRKPWKKRNFSPPPAALQHIEIGFLQPTRYGVRIEPALINASYSLNLDRTAPLLDLMLTSIQNMLPQKAAAITETQDFNYLQGTCIWN